MDCILEKITTFEELDEILPLIDKFHKTQPYCNLYTKTGYLSWLINNFSYLTIWVAYKEVHHAVQDVPVGYCISGIQYTMGVKEAIIYEVYTERMSTEENKCAFQEIEAWAKENKCLRLECYTEHEGVVNTMLRRYGFEKCRTHLMKQL